MAEIEKLLKKVDEGVVIFEQIWDKVYSATNATQKERYEGDLKKEIKKLQRLRDQIKTWQGDSSIKDKSRIDLARKLIEEKMEKFKVCEKETKTKAFSKEGLAQDRTDPKERAKREVGDWITTLIGRLRDQMDEFEVEVESLQTAAASKKKGKAVENPKVEALKHRIERHEHHVEMLEKVLRAVDNEAISIEEANDLQEQVEYYVDNIQEPDYMEDEEMYDHLDLERAMPTVAINSLAKKADEKDEIAEQLNLDDKEATKLSKVSPAKPSGVGASPPPASSPTKSKGAGATSPKKSAPSPEISPKPSPPVPARAASQPIPVPVPPIHGSLAGPLPSRTGPLLSAIVKGSPPSGPTPAMISIPSTIVSSASVWTSRSSSTNDQPAESVAPSLQAPAASIASNLVPKDAVDVAPRPPPINEGIPHPSPMGFLSAPKPPSDTTSMTRVVEHKSPPLPSIASLGVSPSPSPPPSGLPSHLSSPFGSSSLPQYELAAQVSQLNAASQFLPESALSEFGSLGRQSTPRNPASVPHSFPTSSADMFDDPSIFETFDVDTLFFIFYYQQGTYQQYLAARELKRQSWRFHKKYLTWFQRHEEPKVTTDTYEQGTYVYFDYVLKDELETGWCQRIKSEFVFDYEYLEDEPMPLRKKTELSDWATSKNEM